MMDYSSSICKKNSPNARSVYFKVIVSLLLKNLSSKKKKILSKNINFYLIETKNKICFVKNPKFQFYKISYICHLV